MSKKFSGMIMIYISKVSRYNSGIIGKIAVDYMRPFLFKSYSQRAGLDLQPISNRGVKIGDGKFIDKIVGKYGHVVLCLYLT